MTSRNRITFIITALAFSLASFSTLPQYTRADTPPERPWLRESIPYSQGAHPLTVPKNRAPSAADASAADVRLVFSSYRNNHWEIFIADGNGNNQALLPQPYNTALRPSLRRGGGRVAYISEYDTLQVASMSGQGERYQVSGSANSPQWSPSGRMLAFTLKATRQSTGHIHTKHESVAASYISDCLTCDLSGNHAEPTWSPDGREIVWVRVAPGNTQTGSLWRMSADGKNKRQITGEMFYLSDPAWSRDGNFIAFDAAPSAQDWNRLYVMNLATGQVTQVYNPDQAGVDAWMGDWTPDGAALLFSRVEYAVENNQLVLYQTFVERVPASGGNPQQLTFSGRDLYPEATWLDRIPPVSHFAPLPPAAKLFLAPLITASDAGGSGLSGKVDVQYRVGESGSWQNVTLAFCWPGSMYSGPIGPCTNSKPGDRVYLRSRAYDNAGNVEDWPTNPDYDTLTTLYDQTLTGTVKDVRDVPLAGASIAAMPQTVVPAMSQPDGVYSAYFAGTGQKALTPTLSTYGPTHGVKDDISSSSVFHVLPPKINFIQNGDFEQDGAGWQFDPTQPTIVFNIPHSGLKGANLAATMSFTPSYMVPPIHLALSQTVTLPANLHQPTLSFLYRPSNYYIPLGSDTLSVTVTSENSAALIKLIEVLPGMQPWRHVWLDASPWAGKTITITFEALVQPNGSITLDEVSLGEWKTPVVVSITPNKIVSAGNNTIVVSGTNFIDTPAVKIGAYPLANVTQQPDGTLTGDLPAQLPAGQYDVQIINPEGQSSVLTNAFQFGSRVLAPIMTRDVE